MTADDDPDRPSRMRPEPTLRLQVVPAGIYRIGEAAAFLGISREELGRWNEQGKAPAVLSIGGHRRFTGEALLALREKMAKEGNGEERRTTVTYRPSEVTRAILRLLLSAEDGACVSDLADAVSISESGVRVALSALNHRGLLSVDKVLTPRPADESGSATARRRYRLTEQGKALAEGFELPDSEGSSGRGGLATVSMRRPPAELWDQPHVRDALRKRDFGDVFQQLHLAGYSQSMVAAMINRSQSWISATVNSRTPVVSLVLLEHLVVALGIPSCYVGLACAEHDHYRRDHSAVEPRVGDPEPEDEPAAEDERAVISPESEAGAGAEAELRPTRTVSVHIDPDCLYSTQDAAMLLGSSLAKVSLWVSDGILKAFRLSTGGPERVTGEELLRVRALGYGKPDGATLEYYPSPAARKILAALVAAENGLVIKELVDSLEVDRTTVTNALADFVHFGLADSRRIVRNSRHNRLYQLTPDGRRFAEQEANRITSAREVHSRWHVPTTLPGPEVWDDPLMRRALREHNFGLVYRLLHFIHGYTQTYIGKVTDRPQQRVRYIANRETPLESLQLIRHLAKSLGIPPGYVGLACCPCEHTDGTLAHEAERAAETDG